MSSAAIKPQILFAHGAGAGSSHPWMRSWAERMSDLGAVTTFDYSYLKGGRKMPPKAESLVDQHVALLKSIQTSHPGAPVFLAGKSMGSRVSVHVAATAGVAVNGVIAFGYPLRGANGKLRDAVLAETAAPVLFITGTKDAMCNITELETCISRSAMPSGTAIHAVEGGDHSLEVAKMQLKAQGVTQDAVDRRSHDVIREFVQRQRSITPIICAEKAVPTTSSSKRSTAGRKRPTSTRPSATPPPATDSVVAGAGVGVDSEPKAPAGPKAKRARKLK